MERESSAQMPPALALLGLITYAVTLGYVVLYLAGRVLLRLMVVSGPTPDTTRAARGWQEAAHSLPTSTAVLLLAVLAGLLGGWALSSSSGRPHVGSAARHCWS